MRYKFLTAVLAASTALSDIAMATIPEGCVDKGDGTCIYREKNVTSQYDTSSGYILQKTVLSAAQGGEGVGVSTNVYNYSYDANGNVSELSLTQYPDGSDKSQKTVVQYSYDEDNNLISATRQSYENYDNPNVNNFAFNELNMFDGPHMLYTSEPSTDPYGNPQTYVYDTHENGNKTKTYLWDENNGEVYTYNSDGILIGYGYIQNGETNNVYTLDNNGALLSVGAQAGTVIDVTYDENGGFSASESYGQSNSYKLTIDPNYTLPDGRVVTLQTMWQEKGWTGEPLETVSAFAYLQEGKEMIVDGYTNYDKYGNPTYIRMYYYTEDGQPENITNKYYSYTYDEDGQILTCSERNNSKDPWATCSENSGSNSNVSGGGTNSENSETSGSFAPTRNPKRIYTVEEAAALSKETGNTFRLRYK
ncbi:MAG: hypothetical protein IJ870_04775 [Alphaproteobacteria bacterium]|nr:hypothetical protein [Alphaproteobacteria bacterium]